MTLTDAAYLKLLELNKDNKALRISVIGGGCSGLSYKMEFIDFSSIAADDHQVSGYLGLNIAINPKSWLFLSQLQIDYDGGLNGTGFNYSNPAAKKSCGCGSSFST